MEWDKRMTEDYQQFLESKRKSNPDTGFEPDVSKFPKEMFDFQHGICVWACKKGRAAIFAGTGTGKSLMSLSWADQVCNHTGGDVIMLAPLAVAQQTVREGEKFGINVNYCRSQHEVKPGVNITNYEMLEHFDTHQFAGVVLDEAGILKNFSGKIRNRIIDSFCRTQYKLTCTATPSPNDHMELGNQCEFLGIMNYSEMLATYFVHDGGDTAKWRVKGHAVEAFWQWVASWAVMMQNPRDLGYNGDMFDLPPLNIVQHTVTPKSSRFQGRGVAKTLNDRRDARRESMEERIQKCADIVNASDETWVVWCGLNKESEELTRRINGAVEVTGSDKPEDKESRILGFSNGDIRILVSKSEICGFGINMQVCHNMAFVGISDCYDEATEILTLRGWLKFSDVLTSDMVASVNPEAMVFEWQHPSRVIYEHYSGDMIHFKSNSMDLLVTPNHKVFVKRPESRYRTGCNGYELKYASDIVDNYMRMGYSMLSTPQGGFLSIPIDIVDIPVNPKMRINTRSRLITKIESDDYIRLVGWYVTEGYCRPINSPEAGRIAICQTDKNDGENRSEIIELMRRIGLNVNDKGKNITGYSYNLAEYLLKECGTSSYDMRIPSRLKNASKDQLILLRDTILKGDGCHTDGVPRFLRTVSKQLADDFQEICIKTGMRASVHKREYTNKDYPDKSCYDVSVTFKRNAPAIHKKPEVIKYTGMIGCVEVPNHVIIIRRNGIPIVSGNSFEQYYQFIRRCWRFGQDHQVNVHIITSEAEGAVVQNIKEKEKRFNEMLKGMISASQEITKENIRGSYRMSDEYNAQEKMVVPSWI